MKVRLAEKELDGVICLLKNAAFWDDGRKVKEDGILHSHRRGNLKSYIVFLYGEASYQQFLRNVGSYKSHTA
jgi:hypothetical protein